VSILSLICFAASRQTPSEVAVPCPLRGLHEIATILIRPSVVAGDCGWSADAATAVTTVPAAIELLTKSRRVMLLMLIS